MGGGTIVEKVEPKWRVYQMIVLLLHVGKRERVNLRFLKFTSRRLG
jgi:hypothetical protein